MPMMYRWWIKVTAGEYQRKCLVVEGHQPAEMLQMGWFFPVQQNHVLTGKVSAGCSYAISNRMAARCQAVRKTLIKAIELGFCRLVSFNT